MYEAWLEMPSDVHTRTDATPIDWAPLPETTILDGEYVIREARNTPEELAQAAEVYASGFPALRGCDFELLFRPEGFPIFLGEGAAFNKGNNFMLVVEHVATQKLACCLISSLAKMLRRGEHLVIASHVDHQEKGLGREILRASDQLFERSGVEMAFGWCAAMHTVTQTILIEMGYTPRAVIPGLYRLWAGGDQYRRTVEVFMQKFFGEAEKMCTQELHLLPEVEKLLVRWRQDVL
jgi:hypothetical protein